MAEPITEFRGEHERLSNFFPDPVEYNGLVCPTAEHAFQAAKATNPADAAKIASAPTPGKAKTLGRRVQLRPDWEDVKLEVMADILRVKFAPGTDNARHLLATGDAELVEGNKWGDTFWGVSRGRGQNHLGKLLMQVRDELR